MRFTFVTDDEPIWSEDKSVEVEILNNNSTCIVYTADLSSNAKYNGNVKALRLAIEDMKYKEKGGRIGRNYSYKQRTDNYHNTDWKRHII